MSHTVALKTQFKNMDLLTKAFKTLGWTIKENSKIRTYPGDPTPAAQVTYKHVAVNPTHGGYDLGLVLDEKTGEITPMGDLFSAGRVQNTLGQDLCELKKQYCIEVAREYSQEELEFLEVEGGLLVIMDDGMGL
jgi:hypothetical protein